MNIVSSSLFRIICVVTFVGVSSVNICAQDLSNVIISEFSAANSKIIVDVDGNSSDWIELYNPTADLVDLENWCLTDDSTMLAKWRFPKVSINPGDYLLLFASGKDRRIAGEELHTNFKLSSSGEYLALVNNDGTTIVDEYRPNYKQQYTDLSYGIEQQTQVTSLVASESVGKMIVPTAEIAEQINYDWTGGAAFDDSAWSQVTSAIGFDQRQGGIELENVALQKQATQSSEWGAFPASFATDGISNNFTHTADGDNTPWWEVDLEESYRIEKIVMHNRAGCCQERLYNITIEIKNKADEVVYTSEVLNQFNEGQTPVSPGKTLTLDLISLSQTVDGSKIRISKTLVSGAAEYLTFAEVEVFGYKSYNALINTNIQDEMKGINSSVYVRYPFEVAKNADFNMLRLSVKSDDGFVVWINGQQIATSNAAIETLTFNSTAIETHTAEEWEQFTIPVSLLNEGTNTLAIQGLNIDSNDPSFLLIPVLDAVKVTTLATKAYFEFPTPEMPNQEGVDGVVKDTKFNVDRGFFENPFDLVISSDTKGATLIYTLDSSEPTLENGFRAEAASADETPHVSLLINRTTVVRAAAFKDDHKATNVDTQTYLFLEDVIDSDVMNKNITEDSRYAPLMKQSLTDIPTVSIVIQPNTINKTDDMPASIEYIVSGEEAGFQENAGIRYYGGEWAGPFAKQNFRLYFRSRYGASRLEYPLFEGHDHGISAVSKFDQLELRAGSHDMNQRGFYMSNRFTDDTMLDMGNLNAHGRFVHLYFNGVYWGQYHLRERWNADMLAQYLGGEKEDYEAISGNKNIGGWADPGSPYDGDGSAWEHVKSLRNNYSAIKDYLDVKHYVDFMLMFMFGNSEDEYRCVGPTAKGSGFKFLLNDADGYLRNAGNRTGMDQPGKRNADGPGSIFSMLLEEGDPRYRKILADQIQKHFFYDGAMTPDQLKSRLERRCDEVKYSIIAECARWGYQTPDSWNAAKNDYIRNVIPYRTATVIEQFKSAGFYPDVDAPDFYINDMHQHGGPVQKDDQLSISASDGDIYYTTDGTDPLVIIPPVKNKVMLVDDQTIKSVSLPTSSLPDGWATVGFSDSGWQKGTGSVGYEKGTGYEELIDIDVSSMYDTSSSCLIRSKFTMDNDAVKDIKRLIMYLSFDDAFIAYLNGNEVKRVNIEGDANYNSLAVASREAGEKVGYDLTPYITELKNGENVLAIHGINVSLKSSDFLVNVDLEADYSTSAEIQIASTASLFSEAINIENDVMITARAIDGNVFSALNNALFSIDNSGPVTGIDDPIAQSGITGVSSVYPNPFVHSTTIEFKVQESAKAYLNIFDAYGRRIWNQEVSAFEGIKNKIDLHTQQWSKGVYYYKIYTEKGEIFSGKLVCGN
ncbi:T9SS type A sorting domain-containing protein [Puteibacter caeruleilacunae]|nr:T9SS type A sorting domain-containing protein [Puteibacter caeruleilacunae]